MEVTLVVTSEDVGISVGVHNINLVINLGLEVRVVEGLGQSADVGAVGGHRDAIHHSPHGDSGLGRAASSWEASCVLR